MTPTYLELENECNTLRAQIAALREALSAFSDAMALDDDGMNDSARMSALYRADAAARAALSGSKP